MESQEKSSASRILLFTNKNHERHPQFPEVPRYLGLQLGGRGAGNVSLTPGWIWAIYILQS